MARERTVESRLKSRIEEVGGACEKFAGCTRGDPDRLCSFPNGYHCLAETKWAENVKPEAHQLRRHKFWRERGMDAWVVGCDRHITQLINFALVQSPRLSIGGGPLPRGAPSRYAGGGPWIREDGHVTAGSGYAETCRIEFLPCVSARPEEGGRRRLVRGER